MNGIFFALLGAAIGAGLAGSGSAIAFVESSEEF